MAETPVSADPVLLEKRLKTAESVVVDMEYRLGRLKVELEDIRAGMVKSGQIEDRQLELGE